jgi:type VI secretion system secreted protein Hcp
MAIYMKIDGIDGSVTAKGFEKQIELHSFQFGVGRAISMDSGNAANRSHGRPSLSEITVTKIM